jgi:hypothetical protein
MDTPLHSEDADQSTKDGLSIWPKVRRLADQLEVDLHLARMDLRDRWRALDARVRELETALKRSGKRVSKVLVEELAGLRSELQRLRTDLDDTRR